MKSGIGDILPIPDFFIPAENPVTCSLTMNFGIYGNIIGYGTESFTFTDITGL